MLRFFLLFGTLLFIQSCSKGYGNKLTAKNLNIYFESTSYEKQANALGKFWQNEDLVGNKPQNIKLTKADGTFYIHLIQNKEFKNSELTFNEKKLLLNLQKDLDSAIFTGSKGCQILICDHEFKPLFNIND